MFGIGIFLIIGTLIQMLITGSSTLIIILLITSIFVMFSGLKFSKKAMVSFGGEMAAKIIPIILICVYLLSGLVFNPFTADDVIASEYYKGMKHLVNEEFEEAEEVFTAIEVDTPNDAQVLLAHGILYINMDNPSAAVGYFRSAGSINPYDVNIQYNYALALYLNGDTNGAIINFNEIIKQNPRITRAWINVGKINMEMGNYPKARYFLEQARWLDPESLEIQCQLGVTYYKLMEYEDAEMALEKALKLKPNKEIEAELESMLDEIEIYLGGEDNA